MKNIYNSKIILHIPSYRLDGERLTGIPSYKFREHLKEKLFEFGMSDFQSQDYKIITPKREYKEEVFLIYCDSAYEDDIIKTFLDAVCKFHGDMQMPLYQYEINDISVNVRIGDKND